MNSSIQALLFRGISAVFSAAKGFAAGEMIFRRGRKDREGQKNGRP